MVDLAEVRHAVSELLKNAARSAPPGSAVLLEARCDDDDLQVMVVDQGPGIEPAERARLVQPFERGSDPRQDVADKGPGLAIANTVTAAHGGALHLLSNRPAGLRAP